MQPQQWYFFGNLVHSVSYMISQYCEVLQENVTLLVSEVFQIVLLCSMLFSVSNQSGQKCFLNSAERL